MRTPGRSSSNWSSVAGWSVLAVATVYLTFPLAGASHTNARGGQEIAASSPYTSFDGLRFNGRSDELAE